MCNMAAICTGLSMLNNEPHYPGSEENRDVHRVKILHASEEPATNHAP